MIKTNIQDKENLQIITKNTIEIFSESFQSKKKFLSWTCINDVDERKLSCKKVDFPRIFNILHIFIKSFLNFDGKSDGKKICEFFPRLKF